MLCIAEAWFTTAFFFEWSILLAHQLVVITLAIVKIRCKKETVESWQQSTRKGAHAFVFSFSFPFIFPLLWFVLWRSKCSEWLLLGVATTNWNVLSSRQCLMLVLRISESWVSVQGCERRQSTESKIGCRPVGQSRIKSGVTRSSIRPRLRPMKITILSRRPCKMEAVHPLPKSDPWPRRERDWWGSIEKDSVSSAA